MRIVSLKSDELFHKVNLNVLLYMYKLGHTDYIYL